MKIAICDDCREDAMRLKALLSENHDVVLYSNASQLLNSVRNQKEQYDLYLIDIYLDTISGLELAERLRNEEENAALCFISSSDAFYREAYDLYAVQYLLKPVKKEDLENLIQRISIWLQKEKEKSLRFRWRGQNGMIPYGKILYVSSREHTVYIHCRDGSVQECSGKLNEIAEQICGDVFLRCPQSFIANMYHVSSMNGSELMVKGQSVPVSRRYLAEVKRRYQEILFEEME